VFPPSFRSVIFANETTEGYLLRRQIENGTAVICLSNGEQWSIAKAHDVLQKLENRIEWRKSIREVLKNEDHFLFVNYTNPDLRHIYCAECFARMDLTGDDEPAVGPFQIVDRPRDS